MDSLETTASVGADAEVRAVFRAHIDRIHGYFLYRLGGRTAIVEELTRDVFIGASPDLSTTLDPAALEADLLSRARRELVRFFDGATKNPDVVLGPPGITSMPISAAQRSALEHLERLPIDQRCAVVLHHIDSLPVGLAAQIGATTTKALETALAAATRSGFDPASAELLDTSVAPETGFALELEDHLVALADGSAVAAPSEATRPDRARGAGARFAPNQTPRLALLALLAVVVGAVIWGARDGDSGSTSTTDEASTPSTATTEPSSQSGAVTSSPGSTSTTGLTTTTRAPSTTAAPPSTSSSTTTTTDADPTPLVRRPSDPAYLDRGPLDPRAQHQTIWTGAEMIIWGGTLATDERIPLTDGAAFDTRLNTWRTLAPAPIEAGSRTMALWAGDQMIVVSPEETLGYRHWLDEWVRLGDGITPGPAIWADRTVVLANGDGISRFDAATGTWTAMPDPGIRQFRDENGEPQRMTDRFEFGLQILDDDLYFVRGCGPNIWRWTGSGWSATARPRFDDLTGPSNILFCAWANQTAVVGDRLLVWSDDEHPSIAYDPRSDTWEQLATPPLRGTEGPAGGLTVGERVLAINWDASVFDATTDEWTATTLPGRVSDARHLVWTGDEILAWSAEDAWRTTLPKTDP